MKKTVIFAFRSDPMCFIHVLLNGLDLAEHGMGGKIIIEGDAVQLVEKMAEPDHFLHQLFKKSKEQGIIIGACRACSNKLGVADTVTKAGVDLIGDMSGHPGMSEYINKGYSIITF